MALFSLWLLWEASRLQLSNPAPETFGAQLAGLYNNNQRLGFILQQRQRL